MNKDEYIIINKSSIQKRIEEWEIELEECYKAPVGKFNSDYVSTLQQAITTAREILSQSTPLIPEIGKAIDKGYEFAKASLYSSDGTLQPAVLNYITNLKLDI